MSKFKYILPILAVAIAVTAAFAFSNKTQKKQEVSRTAKSQDCFWFKYNGTNVTTCASIPSSSLSTTSIPPSGAIPSPCQINGQFICALAFPKYVERGGLFYPADENGDEITDDYCNQNCGVAKKN